MEIGANVTVDGRPLASSIVRASDGEGRAITPFKTGIVPLRYLFLHSSFASSYDSRYFGPVPDTGLLGLARPVLTFDPYWRRSCLLIAVSVTCGWTAWSGHVLTLPVTVLFPALWAMSPSRLTALLVSAGYFLAASRGLPPGVANFYAADLWPGLLLWAAASLSFAGTAGKLQVRGIDRWPTASSLH